MIGIFVENCRVIKQPVNTYNLVGVQGQSFANNTIRAVP